MALSHIGLDQGIDFYKRALPQELEGRAGVMHKGTEWARAVNTCAPGRGDSRAV